jgi:ribosomal protein S18 acetylase RimI-like enzyme
MSVGTIKTATFSDKENIIDTLVLSFSADPVERWLYPGPRAYLTNFPIFLTAFAAKTFESEKAYYVNDYAGAALWLPPNVDLDDEAINTSLEQTLDKQRQPDAFALLEQMSRYHPHEPHWYLAIIGVDAAQQGQGVGSMLMQHSLALCDSDRALAYLESTNPKNIPFYERHGFELLGTIQVGASPPMFPMLRKPQ